MQFQHRLQGGHEDLLWLIRSSDALVVLLDDIGSSILDICFSRLADVEDEYHVETESVDQGVWTNLQECLSGMQSSKNTATVQGCEPDEDARIGP